jgi:hypothetical protein
VRADSHDGSEFRLQLVMHPELPLDQCGDAFERPALAGEAGRHRGIRRSQMLEFHMAGPAYVALFTAQASGSVQLWVNDAVLDIGGLTSRFYKNNHGSSLSRSGRPSRLRPRLHPSGSSAGALAVTGKPAGSPRSIHAIADAKCPARIASGYHASTHAGARRR